MCVTTNTVFGSLNLRVSFPSCLCVCAGRLCVCSIHSFPSRRKKEEQGDSENEEEEIKEKEQLFQERRAKEKREAEAAAKAEGETVTSKTIVPHTFDSKAEVRKNKPNRPSPI